LKKGVLLGSSSLPPKKTYIRSIRICYLKLHFHREGCISRMRVGSGRPKECMS
ncbi:unnamed protein product, partial [Musa banksii]